MNTNLNEKNKELANLIFPDITTTLEDLEIKYPKRILKEGAKVTRFAPSPTGFLHTGALYTLLVNKKQAEQSEGVFYLRIEDTDRKREVKGSVARFTEELKSFGIDIKEGVISGSEELGNYGPYTQSKREEIYKVGVKYLIEKGLAYPCFCTPEMSAKTREFQENNKIIPGYYSVYAKCRNISIDESIERIKNGDKYIIRFRSSGSQLKKISFIDGIRGKIEIAENNQDIVLIKGDSLPTYHLAHVLDDHFMRTNLIIRGEEWIPSVPIHLELFKAMDFEDIEYAHVSAVMIQDGTSKRKLSKRKDKAAAVSYFIESGYSKEAIMEYLLTIINSDYEPWRMKNPLASNEEFKVRLSKMNVAGALFDIVKLNDVSKELISKMTSSEVLNNVLAWSKIYDEKFYELMNKDLEYSLKIFGLERDNVKKIRKDIIKWEDVKEQFFYFFDELYLNDISSNGYEFDYIKTPEETKITKELVKKVVESYIEKYDCNLDKQEWFDNLKEIAETLGFCTNMKEYKLEPEKYIGSIADFSSVIRIGITNRHNTPDIYSIMQILGKDKVIDRLTKVQKSI
jgi:glutamyl-tRNA synthetase